ncbi:MAG: Rrf2 family transcriptional regulator [Bdellovibrionales bacterium]|nr:Rrf2 family transcriptional regulator [Bdellovibrionales bacterium]
MIANNRQSAAESMLSTPTKHALRALMALASTSSREFVSVGDLAKQTRTPPAYLAKILRTLSQQKMLASKKGVGGGVSLNRTSITFLEVCEALKDPIVKDNCMLSNKRCSKDRPCPFHTKWSTQRRAQLELLSSMKIERKEV